MFVNFYSNNIITEISSLKNPNPSPLFDPDIIYLSFSPLIWLSLHSSPPFFHTHLLPSSLLFILFSLCTCSSLPPVFSLIIQSILPSCSWFLFTLHPSFPVLSSCFYPSLILFLQHILPPSIILSLFLSSLLSSSALTSSSSWLIPSFLLFPVDCTGSVFLTPNYQRTWIMC